MTAQDRGWGHPDTPGYFRENIRKLSVAGITLSVHKGVLPLFRAFIEELVGTGYRLDRTADDWGYANRYVRGSTTVKSNHAWGLAIDLNATTNPMTNDGLVHTDLPPGVSRMAAKYGLRWGGDYKGRKDPMHFEFIGTPADASRRVAQLSPTRSNTPTSPTQPKEDDAMTPAQEKVVFDSLTHMRNELDMLRRDMREIGEKLGLEIGNRTTLDGKIES